MSNDSTPDARKGCNFVRDLRIAAVSLGILLSVVIAAVVGVSLWFSPTRLSRMIEEKSSEFLNAEVKVYNPEWHIWKSIPWLTVSFDSLSVTSHSLNGVGGIPPGASRLLTIGKTSTQVNMKTLLDKKLELRSTSVTSPSVNIVVVNDSVANFLIMRDTIDKRELSDIELGDIRVVGPAELAFRDMSENASGNVRIDKLALKPLGNGVYDMDASITAGGCYNGISLPFPVKMDFDGMTSLKLHPLSATLTDFKISLPGITSVLNLSVNGTQRPYIESFDGTADIPDALSLLSLVPEKYKSRLPGWLIEEAGGRNKISAAVSFMLNSAWHPLSHTIPDAGIDISVITPFAVINAPGRSPIEISNADFKAHLSLNPADSASNMLNVEKLNFSVAKALNVEMTAKVADLLSDDPIVTAHIKADADIADVNARFMPRSGIKATGKTDISSDAVCRLSSLTSSPVNLKKLNINGTVSSPLLTLADITKGIHTTVKSLDLSFSAEGNGEASEPSGKVSIKASSLALRGKSGHASVRGLDLSLAGALRSVPFTPASSFPSKPVSSNDSLLQAFSKHTPLYLVADLPGNASSLLSLADVSEKLSVKSGSFFIPSYPEKINLSFLNASGNLDSLRIKSMHISSCNTNADISGSVSGIRSFILSPSPVPLHFNLNAKMDNVDINRLCGTYYAGLKQTSGKTPSWTVPDTPLSAADSTAVMIPRNIFGKIHLSSNIAEYTEFSFAPLSTDITLDSGNARIGNLNIGTTYCTALLDWSYFTSDMGNIGMGLTFNISDFGFQEFAGTFHGLVKDTSVLDGINGNVSVSGTARFLMFPDMFINTPSLSASFAIKGDSLSLDRDSKKLLKYTHLAMMGGDKPLPVSGLDAKGYLHDNFLEIRPFDLTVDNYKFLIGGANNLAGEMYYHIGLVKSPLHVPFGINLEGNFRKPKIRFGGKDIKHGYEKRIPADLNENVNVNIMHVLRRGWLQFVAAAAKYDFMNNQKAYSDVE